MQTCGSLQSLVSAAGITKNWFFCHFPDKDILPKQIMLYRDFVRAVFLGA